MSQCVGVMVGGGGVKVCGCDGGGWWRFHSVGVRVGVVEVSVCGCEGGGWWCHSVWV